MNWLVCALGAIILNSLMDFFVKLSSDKIHSGFGAFIIDFVSTITVLIFLIFSKIKGDSVFQVKPGGILYSVLAGISIGLASIFFLKMFALGTNLSVGVPIVRVGIILFASLLGIFVLKESVNLKYFLGFCLSLLGLYLLITAK